MSEKIEEMSEKSRQIFQKLQGKVFHTIKNIGGQNYMNKYRIGVDGKLTLEESLLGSFLGGKEVQEILTKAGNEVREDWRKVVTGDPNKRVRDYMKETPQVKKKDKFSFTLGVMTITLSEWLILRHPEYFPHFYIPLMLALIIWRFVDYSKTKSELFLLDYCYFVNISVAIQVLYYPDNLEWFQANYVACLGPICLAIPFWHNSLVFHSLDKVTSFFLHAFPPVVMHLHRWKFIDNNLPLDDDAYLSLYGNFYLPIVFYMIWQISYLFITEVLLSSYLKDETITTSLRYLVTDKKNPSIKQIRKFLTKQGVIKKGEELDPNTLLGKSVFVFGQVIYTCLTILHVRGLYASYLVSCIYIIITFGIGVWNGASYYIEVFSTRYNLKFQPKPETKSSENQDTTVQTEEKESDADSFVDVLENLDLDKPEDLKLYTTVLESIATSNDDNTG